MTPAEDHVRTVVWLSEADYARLKKAAEQCSEPLQDFLRNRLVASVTLDAPQPAEPEVAQ